MRRATRAITRSEAVPLRVDQADRLKRLPPYLFAEISKKIAAKRALGLGGSPWQSVEVLRERGRPPTQSHLVRPGAIEAAWRSVSFSGDGQKD